MCIQVSMYDVIEENYMLANNNSLFVLQAMEDNSVDSIVTDPPYGISFMGKDWDKALPPVEIWKECMRVLKPGGYLVAMSASRTYHRLAVQLEDLGMICHPMIGWIYGSGFPKATDLSKQFDKQAGAEREKGELIRTDNNIKGNNYNNNQSSRVEIREETPSNDLAKKWNGYKYGLQALKPALEPIAVFQKPWKLKAVKRMTDNVKLWGVGAFNINACRVPTHENLKERLCNNIKGNSFNSDNSDKVKDTTYTPNSQGRHPANLIHDGSESVEKVFLEQARPSKGGKPKTTNSGFQNKYVSGKAENNHKECEFYGSPDSVARFFNKLPFQDIDAPFLYQAKASKAERGEGNDHPTVKPIALMEWLIKLVTPEGGITVDPFLGSGTTVIAAIKNGFKAIGIEESGHNFQITSSRIAETIEEIAALKRARDE